MEIRGEATTDVHLSGDKGIEDMIKMNTLDEESILKNLKIRYLNNLIYTNTGSILVSLNPYKRLPIYAQEVVREYIGTSSASMGPAPHIFATAEACYHDMRDRHRNQSVIISGESGAGKTEATKLILQFLAARTTKHSAVEQKILESSPILEAFGNAKTVRNDNSSRFGKFIEIHFEGSGQICGAKISNYLLERSRLVWQAQSERNYHIFYQFLAGADKEEKERYQLLDIEQYNYLNQSGCTSVPTINDEEDYNRVRQALLAMDMSADVQDHLFTILSGIMRLGNVQFEGAEVSKVSNPQELEIVGQLLKISPEGLGRALTTRTLVVSGQKIQVNFKAAQAADARDALAKAIYSKLFDWIVVTINKVIYKPKPVKSFIGVLDIFGFENFNVNSFEQFCINYANEKLQQYFNETIFKIEQTEYSTEAIKWDNIDFNDNQDTIDLIEKTRPPGIISLLDEECRFPKATDTTFLEKIDNGYKTHKKFYRPKKSRTAFVIKHYAGEVAYETANFLEKNRDTLAEDLVALLNDSKLPLVKALFPLSEVDTQSSGRQAKSPTVGTNFKAQLAELMATLGATAPHYVRCIKPNTMKAPAMFDDDMVLAQLRYAGMMETIRIRRLGYPVRYPVKEFMYRYRMLLPLGYANDPKNKDKSGQLDLFAVAKNILSKVPSPSEDGSLQWQLGKTKVFMKEAQSAAVENTRNKAIWAKVVTIQSWWRMVWTRNYFAEMRQAAKLIQSVVRGFLQRRRYAVLIAADRRRKEEARKKSEEESRRREEERLAKEQARRSEGERLMKEERKNEKSVPALSVTQPRVHSVLYDEKPTVSMYKTSSPLVTVNAADDAAPGLLGADSAWRDQKDALDAKGKAVDPAAASLRRRLTSKRDATIKRHTPMLRKGDSGDQYPDVIGKDEASKYDILEYAQTHFNFERVKKRTIRTLGRKKGDFSISEILCYSKKLEQPLHTTQNANFIKFAVKFFKMITRFVDGEAHFDVLKEVFLAGISNGGSLRAFRNELYCQVIKQTMKNPSKDSTMRSWELLSAFCGVFYPTDDFVPYLASYLMQNFVNPTEIGQYAQYAYGKLKEMSFHFANKLSRLYPPSRLELEANRERKLIPVWFHVPGGMSTCVMSSAGATAADAFTPLTSKNLKLADPMEFAIFEIYPHLNLGRSLSPSDFLADMLSKAEKYGHESLFWFKKKLWLDPTTLPEDPVEARLETLQIHADIVSGKFPCPHEQALVLSGIRFLIDEIQDAQSTKILNFCERYVPQALIPQKSTAEWTRIVHEEADKIRGFELNESGLVNLFLKKAQKLSLYGKSLFQVQMATTDIDIPDSFMLAIDVNGIEIRDKDSGDLLRHFTYPDLGPVTYDAGSTVVNFHERMQRRPLHIKTPLGVEICSLCEDYLYWLREDSETAVALQDYVVTDKNLLSFTKGQKIELLAREGNWWRGKLNGKTGSFPASMVEILITTANTNLAAGKLRKRLSQRMSTRDLTAMKLTDSGAERSRAGSRRESRVGGVAEPLEMRNVPRKSSRAYYRKMSESSGQHSLALPAMSDRNSARLSRRYEMTEFAQSNFKAVAPTSAGMLKNSRTDLLSNSIGTLRRGMMGSRSKLTTEPPAPGAPAPSVSASTSTPELSVPSVTFTDVPIREPLTKSLPEEFAKEATKIFTMIMKYMGDYPSKKGLDSFKLMQKICQRGIDNPKLRDELYCQLIKQVSKNPKSGNTIRGWELLAISCGLFVPSRALGPYLVDFLTEHIKAEEKQLPKAQQDIQRLAQAGLRRLDRIRAVGMRAHAPSFVEYDAVRCAEQVPCTVWTFDGESHVVRVDMAATVKDVMTHVIESIGLSPAAVAARDWALCAIRGNPDDAKHRFGLETGEKLAEKDHVCDVVAAWEKEEKAKGPVQLLFQEWLTLDQTSPVDDPVAIHLLAHQAVSRIVSGRYPVTEGEAPYLTALQFYFDKLKAKVDEPITEKSLYISLFYLPINLKSRRSDEEWLSAIFNEWNGMDHTMTMTQAESLYLETAQRWKFFGGNVFYAESKQFPKANALAVHRDGLAVLRLPEKEPLAFAPFRAIFNWSSTQNSVGVVVGSLMNPHRYVFSTSQAPSMVQTFVCYMEKLVAETKQQEESKAQGFSQATLRDMRTPP